MLLPAPPLTAREAGLRHVDGRSPGIQRIRWGGGFRYRHPDGTWLPRAHPAVARIEALAIPPAWTAVWVCTDPRGHVQATGRDARGRKQYRYHPRWCELRNRAKFAEMPAFGAALPRLRRRILTDLDRPGLPRVKVLACVVRLLDRTLIRVGNAAYARDNGTFGLTTLRNRHVRIDGEALRFSFRTKSGRQVDTVLSDPVVARVVRRCQDLPGQPLFQYVDPGGQSCEIDSADVNEYLADAARGDYTAKDFRTWGGSVTAASALYEAGPLPAGDDPDQLERELRRREVHAVRQAAAVLGNTLATCRRFYVHPGLVLAYAEGRLERAFEEARARRTPSELRLSERAVLRVLEGA